MRNNLKIICFIGIYYTFLFNLSFIKKYQKNNYATKTEHENSTRKKTSKNYFKLFIFLYHILLIIIPNSRQSRGGFI